jgi:membrane-bound metal-dependent hydrolase YbcI (DUF457 family)
MDINIPILLVLSVIPDVDLIYDFFLKTEIHRGPTHSIIIAILVFIPFFIFYRKRAIPYFAALSSHSLIGDFPIAGHVQLLWPLTAHEYCIRCDLGLPYISVQSQLNIALELTLFTLTLLIFLKTKDIYLFFRNSKTNLLLIIPILTVLLPSFLSFPVYVPLQLLLPHLFYLTLFGISVFVPIIKTYKKKFTD